MRYSKVAGKFPREIVLLKALSCSYGKCNFCNYTLDNNNDGDLNFIYNSKILANVTGDLKILEVINSGNIFDLDQKTLALIVAVVKKQKIEVVYFECYLNHLAKLKQIRCLFPDSEVRFRLGLETFDDGYREVLGKKFILTTELLKRLSTEYYSVCLLVGTASQTKAMIERDIMLGLKYFRQITVNIFKDNQTLIKPDLKLQKWFISEYYEQLTLDSRVELLIDNHDLGVFEQ